MLYSWQKQNNNFKHLTQNKHRKGVQVVTGPAAQAERGAHIIQKTPECHKNTHVQKRIQCSRQENSEKDKHLAGGESHTHERLAGGESHTHLGRLTRNWLVTS